MAGKSHKPKVTKKQKTQAAQKMYEFEKFYVQEKKIASLEHFVDEALALDPTNSKAHTLKFIITKLTLSADAPDYKTTMAQAVLHLEQAVKFDKNNLQAKFYKLTHSDPEIGKANQKALQGIIKAKSKTTDDLLAKIKAHEIIDAGDEVALQKHVLDLMKKAVSEKKFKDDILAHYKYASELLGFGQTDEAIVQFREVLELEPNLPGLHAKISAILGDQGKYEESIASIKRAVELDSQEVDYHYDLGLAYCAYSRQLGREGKETERERVLKESVDELNLVLSMQHDNIDAIAALANVYCIAGRYGEAVEMFKRGLSIDSSDAYCLGGLASTYSDQGKDQLALEHSELALEHAPENVLYLCNYAKTLTNLDRAKEALVQIKKAQAIATKRGYGDDLDLDHREHIEIVFTETKAELLGVLAEMGEDIAELAVGAEAGDGSLQDMLAGFMNKNILGATKAKWDAVSAGLKAIGSAGDEATKAQVEKLIQQKEALDRLREQKLNAEQIQAELTNLETRDQDAYEYCFGFSKTLIRAYDNATTAAGGKIAINVDNVVSTFSALATLIPFGGDVIAAGIQKAADSRMEAKIKTQLFHLEQVTLVPGEFNNIATRIALKVTYAKQSEIAGYKTQVKTGFSKFCDKVGKLGKALTKSYDTDPYKGDLQKLGNVDATPLLKELFKGDKGEVGTRPSHTFEERATKWCMEHSPSSHPGPIAHEVEQFFELALSGCEVAVGAYVG